eukprot:6459803-Amphidinium_carterae.2
MNLKQEAKLVGGALPQVQHSRVVEVKCLWTINTWGLPASSRKEEESGLLRMPNCKGHPQSTYS